MKNFSWNYFSMSGKVESYLLYKDLYSSQSLLDDPEFEANLGDDKSL
jgi:hypothetical protein